MQLKHHFLIAMPNMSDPNFKETVAYICEHNENGALGLVVNKPTELSLPELMSKIEIPLGPARHHPESILFGGPVQPERGFVLHRGRADWNSTLKVGDGISLTTSRDVLEALGRGEGPSDIIITLGYAGWQAGQLEDEIVNNAWLTVPADPNIIFDTPPELRYQAAIDLLGFDLSRLSSVVGHA